jgi:hypothetical protein
MAIPLVLLAAACLSAQAGDSPEASFASLRSKAKELEMSAAPEKRVIDAGVSNDLTVCGQGAATHGTGDLSQYIYNGVYSWSILPTANGFCVHLFLPFNRPLAVDEARDLLVGSRMEFPVDASPVPANAEEPRMGRGFGKDVN